MAKRALISGTEVTKAMRASQGAKAYAPSGIFNACKVWHERLQLDHIDPDGPHDTSNLQWLCDPCHKAKTSRENSERFSGRPLTPDHRAKLREAAIRSNAKPKPGSIAWEREQREREQKGRSE